LSENHPFFFLYVFCEDLTYGRERKRERERERERKRKRETK